MKKLISEALLLLVTIFGLSFASCGDDDDEPAGGSLAGTSWQIISDTDDDELAGVTITFNSNGNCTFSPSYGWTYAKWSQSGNKLKIILGEGEPDDYIEGTFVINGNNATYSYSWYDYDGEWGGEDSAVMTLKRK